jgi:hypothetical protein
MVDKDFWINSADFFTKKLILKLVTHAKYFSVEFLGFLRQEEQ